MTAKKKKVVIVTQNAIPQRQSRPQPDPIHQHSNGWYGFNRDKRDPRDHLFHVEVMRLPATVDLRDHCPPVMDQDNLGGCVSHGVTGALRHCLLAAGQPDVPMSRLQNYFDSRVLEGTVASDAGAEIRDGIKAAAALGVGHESLWPYDISRFTQKPPATVYADALHFKALNYQRVSVNTTAIKSALAQGFPVIVGFAVFESFESLEVEKTGVVPMPNLNVESFMGGHCVYVVGYGQHKSSNHSYFTCRNSWGVDWGSGGDFFIPTTYLGSSKYSSDFWIVEHDGGT